MLTSKKIKETISEVYDISLDGTVINALGLNVISNTDGFNFKGLPEKYRYNKENPYIGKGLNRNVVEGKNTQVLMLMLRNLTICL